MRTNICLAFMALFALVPFTGINAQYSLTVESAPAVTAGGTVYRFYVNANDPTDKMSAVFGNDQSHLVINAPGGIFNSPFQRDVGMPQDSFRHSLPVFRTWLTTAISPLVLEGPASLLALHLQTQVFG